ncbi:hypothetical protein [Labrys neptuniae]
MVKLVGGKKLELALDEIAKNVSKASSVKIGFMEDATYPGGTPVSMVAAIQEFGAPARNIPPRPYFRGMIEEKSPEWPQAIANLLVANRYDAAKTLGQAGEAIKGQLQQAIINFDAVPLSPITVAKKGNDKQLVDTGQMLNSVTYQVIAGEKVGLARRVVNWVGQLFR